MDLLNYKGRSQVTQSLQYKNEYLNDVNTLVFCKIVIRIIEILQELDFHLNINQLTKKAVEIYKDVSLSSNDQETQMSMVDLSITTFNRQIKELIEDEKKASDE